MLFPFIHPDGQLASRTPLILADQDANGPTPESMLCFPSVKLSVRIARSQHHSVLDAWERVLLAAAYPTDYCASRGQRFRSHASTSTTARTFSGNKLPPMIPFINKQLGYRAAFSLVEHALLSHHTGTVHVQEGMRYGWP